MKKSSPFNLTKEVLPARGKKGYEVLATSFFLVLIIGGWVASPANHGLGGQVEQKSQTKFLPQPLD